MGASWQRLRIQIGRKVVAEWKWQESHLLGFTAGPRDRCHALLVLLVFWRLPQGGALSLGEKRLSEVRGPSAAVRDSEDTEVHEFRKRFQELLDRLRVNQSRVALHADRIFAPTVRILTPEVRLGSDGLLHLRLSRASLSEELPAASRLHRALLQLSPTSPKSWDVTAPLKRQLSVGGSRTPELHLRLSPPPDQSLASASRFARPQLELHLRARDARGRRGGQERAWNDCPLGEGRCCRLQTIRASVEQLGWADWVVSPRVLEVSFCGGQCPSHYHVANIHTQMKTSLNRLKPHIVPAPCCVASSWEPLEILQKTSSGQFHQVYQNVLAKSCHCE
ncbi:Growth/differentiation factor 15 [Tupaia chinensis]|uniref:Growth/differentiation factor 15 n=1 Tax=Tupaia chinensis TaxID=246437 RepID=L9L191_TUPCH|nr:Growth/differentiation factor 15 [Tupaia chinensis]